MTTLTRRQFAHGAVAHGVVALTGAAALTLLPQVSRAAQPITTLSNSASLPPPDPLFLLLNRTSFGISDGDMAHAQAIGFEAYVESSMEEWNVPGAAIAIVKDDKIIYERGFGVRDIADGKEVDVTTAPD